MCPPLPHWKVYFLVNAFLICDEVGAEHCRAIKRVDRSLGSGALLSNERDLTHTRNSPTVKLNRGHQEKSLADRRIFSRCRELVQDGRNVLP